MVEEHKMNKKLLSKVNTFMKKGGYKNFVAVLESYNKKHLLYVDAPSLLELNEKIYDSYEYIKKHNNNEKSNDAVKYIHLFEYNPVNKTTKFIETVNLELILMVDITDENLLFLTIKAHAQNLTLNQLVVNIQEDHIKKEEVK